MQRTASIRRLLFLTAGLKLVAMTLGGGGLLRVREVKGGVKYYTALRLKVRVCVCALAGASMGDPRGRLEAQHDGGGAGAVRPQQTGGADRVAPDQQRHPLQRRL